MLTSDRGGDSRELPAWCRARRSVDHSQAEIDALLDELDRSELAGQRNRRREPRLTWRGEPAIVEIEFSATEKTTCLAVTRNLSVGGMCFLYAHTVPPRSRMKVMAATHEAIRWALSAEVVRCRQLGHRLYEIGLRFIGARKGQLLMK